MTIHIGGRRVRRADPTLDLLVQLALHAPPEATLARARALLEHPIDWRRLTALARQHRLRPILVHNLERLGAEPPPDWWARIRDDARHSAMRASVLSGELILLQRGLRARGIPSIAVKGPALGVLAHGSPLFRTMADLDLVVRERDFDSAFSLLHSRGYQPLPVVDAEVRGFTHRGHSLRLEVHRRVDKRYLPLFPLDDDVWSSPERVGVMGAPVDVLPIEMHASFLVYHGCRHRWCRLGWLSVLVDLLRNQPHRLDGEALAHEAERRGNGSMVRLTASLVRDAWPDVGALLPVRPGRSRAVLGMARRVRSDWGKVEPPPGRHVPAREHVYRVLRNAYHTVLLADRPLSRVWTAARVARKILARIVPFGRAVPAEPGKLPSSRAVG